jgi:hypothetical protein
LKAKKFNYWELLSFWFHKNTKICFFPLKTQ